MRSSLRLVGVPAHPFAELTATAVVSQRGLRSSGKAVGHPLIPATVHHRRPPGRGVRGETRLVPKDETAIAAGTARAVAAPAALPSSSSVGPSRRGGRGGRIRFLGSLTRPATERFGPCNLPPIRSSYVAVNGLDLCYEVHGDVLQWSRGPTPEPPGEQDRRVDDVSLRWLHDPVFVAGRLTASPYDLPPNRFLGWSSPPRLLV
jgi:hypothetical protein